MIANGYNPRSMVDSVVNAPEAKTLKVEEWQLKLEKILKDARTSLQRANQEQMKQANKKKKPVEFEDRQKVWLASSALRLKNNPKLR